WTTASGMFVRIAGATVGPLASSSASGCTVPGTNGQVIYNGSGACAAAAGFTFDGTSVLSLGVAGTSVGGLKFNNATTGYIELVPTTGALGTSQITMPATTGTMTVLGNTTTGSGNIVLATSPTLTTPALGT